MAVGDDEAKVRAERARAIGLFRYQLIREAADPAHSTKERGQMVRELAAARAHRPVRAAGADLAGRPSTAGSGTGAAAGSTRWCPARASAPRAPRRRCWSWRWRCGGRTRTAPPRRSAGSCAPSWAGRPMNAPCNATSTGSASPVARPRGSAPAVFGRFEAEHPQRPVDWRCVARPTNSAAARRICSRSWTIIPGCCPATGGAMPRTRCGWPPRCARRWPPAASPRPHLRR